MYSSEPIPRPSGPPASVNPLRDHIAAARPGVISADDAYVVLPRALAESMPLPWQQQMSYLIGELHRAYGTLPWPVYRVVPSRTERLVDCDEGQLAEAGYSVELDSGGELVYNDREGTEVTEPEAHTVLVTTHDPVLRRPPRSGAWPAPPS